MNELNSQDAQNILLLINRTPIQGSEAEGVAIIKQKLVKIAGPVKVEEPKKEK